MTPLSPRLLAICLFITAFSFTSTAQYVTIPDTAFVSWLQSNYPLCMNGNQLDTNCSAVLNATSISPSGRPIRNLTGIQYFKNLTSLDCSNDSISYIPSFPATLINITTQINQLTSLPPLPSGLQRLLTTLNPLTSLPTLPSFLNRLEVEYTTLTSLPTLPNSLTILWCDNSQLISLPVLPPQLNSLDCRANQFTSLPALPASLQYLDCSYNHFTTFPTLPAGLLLLDCDSTDISSLPSPLPPLLNNLSCGYNPIASIPPLPASLNSLSCYYTNVTTLPLLPPHMYSLYCSHSQLVSLPELPDSMRELDISNSPSLTCLPQLKRIVHLNFYNIGITCLPNYGNVTSSNPTLGTLPLCGMYNPNGCSTYWDISGEVFYDANNNCQYDSTDAGQVGVKAQLYQNGTLQQQVYSSNGGGYSFLTGNGTYSLQIDTANVPFILSCPDSGYINTTISVADSLSYGNNFALTCRPGFDVGVWSILNSYILPRPNAVVTVNTVAGDISNVYGAHCANGISGVVSLTYSGQVTYVGPAGGALTPTTVNGNTITWNIADFGAVNVYTAFNLLFKIDSLATPGTQVCITVNVTPTNGDYNPSNNTNNYCFTIVNSLDPNEKEVSPNGATDTSQHWLTYTVRFQNTGTAPALNILVEDTLDSHLDPSTFQLLAYSHKNVTQILGNVVKFNFPNINLPDSTADEPNSHGYVQYKIKLKDNLPVGTTINNTAYIYFDFNSPVVTNTTANTITTTTTGISPLSPGEGLGVRLYPNPAKDAVTVEVDNNSIGGTLQLTDVTGRAIITSQIESRTSHIATSFLSSGVYFVKLSNSKGQTAVRKLVVEK
ncbi:MAG TPA: T9SS type A sorting domain-containing protein [Chitinophagales bacterium]|nr:T9SS type A sorting domain-containing protein [Chitinophagales bacterium]